MRQNAALCGNGFKVGKTIISWLYTTLTLNTLDHDDIQECYLAWHSGPAFEYL